MPELPEVETIRRDLLAQVVGCRLLKIDLLWPGMVEKPTPEELCRRVMGQQIQDILRRGKYLLFSLSSGDTLVLHLGMSGLLLVRPASAKPAAFARAVFHLDDGRTIWFPDRRKFGGMWLAKSAEEVVGKLGIEPLEPGFTPEAIGRLFGQRNVPIKALLLEQELIAGIGNMYADEALFAARIHPLRKGQDLSPQEIKRLHQAIRQVLQAGIEHNGASVDAYLRPDGQPGVAQDSFMVAHRNGKTCHSCHSPIERIVVRGRGTYFCPRCQPEQAKG